MSSGFGSRGGFSGRSRSGGCGNSVDMFVPAGDCGKIIGRGGSKIRELQESSGARIKVSRDDEGDGTRRVELSGSESAVAEAERLINDILENGDERAPRQQQSYGNGGGSGGSREVIQIDSSYVGRLIGKGGSKVRELQDESGCRINVSRDGGSCGRTDVELIGSRSAIDRAKYAIDSITSQIY